MNKTKLLLLAIIAFAISSCNNNDSFTIGNNWVESEFDLTYIDTFTVKLSTIKPSHVRRSDSVVTRKSGVLLFGKYTDVDKYTSNIITGTTVAESYFELVKPTVKIDKKAVFDSLVLHVRHDLAYFGDTLAPQHIVIKRVTERMQLPEENYVFYNTTRFQASDILADVKFLPKPISGNSPNFVGEPSKPLSIYLPHSLGLDFFNRIVNDSAQFQTADKFADYFRGIAILPGNESKAITAFKGDSLKVTMYYHIMEDTKKSYAENFTINDFQQFNYINTDRSQSPLKNLSAKVNIIPSESTNNCSYVQSGDVLYTKLEFPNIGNLRWVSPQGIIQRAILKIHPVRTTYNYGTPLPKLLNLYQVNDVGAISEIKDLSGAVQSGNLQIDEMFKDNNSYSYNITDFLNVQTAVSEDKRSFLMLQIPANSAGNSVQRLVIGNSNHYVTINGQEFYNKIKLELYYASYK